jgi:(p)ppGpp synthase/HD superfamily hydrolase
MLRMHTEQAMIAAVLHDVVEDSDWTLAMLQDEGFSQVVLDAVDSLTRREDESYEAYIARLAPNPLARMVKIVDLEDNMDLRRYRHIGDKELARLQRYMQVWQSLQAMQ